MPASTSVSHKETVSGWFPPRRFIITKTIILRVGPSRLPTCQGLLKDRRIIVDGRPETLTPRPLHPGESLHKHIIVILYDDVLVFNRQGEQRL